MAQIQLVIVTPEKTTFDQMVDGVTLPLFDGEAGVMADHAPMIGRLGPGEVRVRTDKELRRFYVDGGNVQIKNNLVTLLTGRSLAAADIDLAAAQAALEAANKQVSDNPMLAELKEKAVAQAKAQIHIASKA